MGFGIRGIDWVSDVGFGIWGLQLRTEGLDFRFRI